MNGPFLTPERVRELLGVPAPTPKRKKPPEPEPYRNLYGDQKTRNARLREDTSRMVIFHMAGFPERIAAPIWGASREYLQRKTRILRRSIPDLSICPPKTRLKHRVGSTVHEDSGL